jgi:palmitoyltransferase
MREVSAVFPLYVDFSSIVALITVYLILFLLMASSFFRIVFTQPGYVPRKNDDPEKSKEAIPDPTTSADIYLCDTGGYPRWCQTCETIKADRAHHSSDAGRCVYKMGILPLLTLSLIAQDHFCPWVGGMVGFTRYKFFLQFVTYTAVYCSFLVASVAPVLPSILLLKYSCWRGISETILILSRVPG